MRRRFRGRPQARWCQDSGRKLGRESGMTLVELVVAMAVTVVLLASVATVFIGALRTLSSVNSTAELSTSSDIAMRTITERLRASDLRPPDTDPANTAVQAAGPSEVSVNVYLKDDALAASLSAGIRAATPADPTASWMASTGLVPKLVRFSFAASSAVCGGKPGLVQTTTPPRLALSGSQIFAWDTAGSSACVLRTTTVPSASTPLFRYFTGCGPSDTESAANLGAIQGIQVQLYATDSTTTSPIVLQNRVCLVNVGGNA